MLPKVHKVPSACAGEAQPVLHCAMSDRGQLQMPHPTPGATRSRCRAGRCPCDVPQVAQHPSAPSPGASPCRASSPPEREGKASWT
eukprot:617475-Heterocapsa_arctica.AAC.1